MAGPSPDWMGSVARVGPAWSCLVLRGCLWPGRQPLKTFTPWNASVQGIGSGTMLRNILVVDVAVKCLLL